VGLGRAADPLETEILRLAEQIARVFETRPTIDRGVTPAAKAAGMLTMLLIGLGDRQGDRVTSCSGRTDRRGRSSRSRRG
jgi:hypothetical protein